MNYRTALESRFFQLSFSIILLLSQNGCESPGKEGEEFYNAEDFFKFEKIDVHAHQLTSRPDLVKQAIADRFLLLSINTEVPDYPPVDSQQYYVRELQKNYADHLYFLSAFETNNINTPGWSDDQLRYLEKSFKNGALGVKVWKNIGMTLKDSAGRFIMIDNPVFDPIFNFLEEKNIPVIGHIGEPKNCWLPLDQMTTNNDRNYFRAHPEYHMYLHPEYPSYDSIIASRDRLLQKHPRLKFIGAHLGSMEWNVDEIARRLDQFPNMYVEPAERFGQLQYQSIQDWNKVRDFFIKYQDRILYGTDLEDNYSLPAGEIGKIAHDLWLRDWRYFTTADSLQSAFVDQPFKGLHLPKGVVDKIYTINPKKVYFNSGKGTH